MKTLSVKNQAITIHAIFLFAACPASAATIEGFIGQSSTMPVMNATVKLIDGKTKKVVDIDETNFFGKYKFKDVRPGYYLVQSGKITRELMVKKDGDTKRLDIDLSASDGTMDYSKSGAAESPGSSSSSGAKSRAKGANNASLQKQIAGTWWGYSGSTEKSIGLCADGVYSDFSESSYSGRSSDSLGNETMAWGAAGQRGGSGSWTITGDTNSGTIHVIYANGSTADIRYSQIGDPGCLSFNGSTLCRKSASCR